MPSPGLPEAPALEQPVDKLKGVGPKVAALLAKLGIRQVKDLLFRLPLRYLDKTRITPISHLRPNSYALVQGEIQRAEVRLGRRRSLVVQLADGTGIATMRLFHFSKAQQAMLARGRLLRCAGQLGHGGEFYHPEYELITANAPPPAAELTPVYATTEGLTQPRLRDLSGQALQLLARADVEELLPGPGHAPLKEALRFLHRPPPEAPIADLLASRHPFQQQLILEELVAQQLSLQTARRTAKSKTAPRLPPATAKQRTLFANLGFTPTAAQQRVIGEIQADLQSGLPMLRLLQGDVGCGKTLVAAIACLAAIAAGKQAALMAPTEILADQHLATFTAWFAPLKITPVLLSGKTRGRTRTQLLQTIAAGHAPLIIGTHALIQQDVAYADLGLLVIDEQHRFGVHQRLSLATKGGRGSDFPHQLIMTATPIPRTLTMSHYSDLDTSIIDQLPPGRGPVTAAAVSNRRRAQVIQAVRTAVEKGRQVYWVCTLIEESDSLQAQAAQATATELRQALPELNIGLLHGRMKSAEKAAEIEAFRTATTQVLVATTVIEVGVDVPNASLMIIENPERLGLAQLHQLRGRVGRGPARSHCLLLYQSPLSQTGKERINAMRQTNDGFKIAEIDLRLRGPGELLGTRQAGETGFLLADLTRDAPLLPRAIQIARQILKTDESRAKKLLQRWLPEAVDYLNA